MGKRKGKGKERDSVLQCKAVFVFNFQQNLTID